MKKRGLIQWLGLLGIVSLLSYTIAVIFSPFAYPNYNWLAQAVSDLSATNSPSKELWNQLSSLYSACGVVSIMMVCVFIQDKLDKTLRIGIYIFTAMIWVSTIGFNIFPLSESGTGGTQFQDIMHVYVVTTMVVILSITSLIFIIVGGYRNKHYKTLGNFALFCLLLMIAGAIGVSASSPEYFGFFERFSVFSANIFNAILGIYLFNGFKEKNI